MCRDRKSIREAAMDTVIFLNIGEIEKELSNRGLKVSKKRHDNEARLIDILADEISRGESAGKE